jgi:hypothetical protein
VNDTVLELTPQSRPTCARCSTELASHALACPACSALVHRDRLEDLAERATTAGESGDRATARACWQEAQTLVPVDSEQYRQIGARLGALADDAPTHAEGAVAAGTWWKSGLGIAGVVGLLLVSKLKFLLLGLSKLGTLVSMFGFIAVYWSIHGWPLAAGMACSIYIHEMGHVAMLRRLGIRADAPLFIPVSGRSSCSGNASPIPSWTRELASPVRSGDLVRPLRPGSPTSRPVPGSGLPSRSSRDS